MYKIKRNGFTLVELMAVIIIISLIALLTFPNIINQIKKTKKSNNKIIEDVVIEQAKKYVSDNDSEYTEDDEYCIPLTKLIDNDYIKEDLISINDIKDNKVIHLTRTENDSYEVMDKDKCVIIPTAVKYLVKRANPKTITNYTDGDIHEMYTFEHEATEQTPELTDYRYIGSDPYNYVTFNGNELWRIIGIFKVEDENDKWEDRLKLIRNESIGKMAWDTNNVNEWTTASLNLYLNNDYYNTIYDGYKRIITDSKYYISGSNTKGTTNFGTGIDIYNSERSSKKYSVDRSINYCGKIALLYPSDFIYTYALGVDNVCFENGYKCYSPRGGNPSAGWIYNLTKGNIWLLSPRTSSDSISFVYTSYLYNVSNVNSNYKIIPVLYLSSKVRITSGDGSIDNAYKISM